MRHTEQPQEFRTPAWFSPQETATVLRLQPEYDAEQNEVVIVATSGDQLYWIKNEKWYDLVYCFAQADGRENIRGLIRLFHDADQDDVQFLSAQTAVKISSRTEGTLAPADGMSTHALNPLVVGADGLVRIRLVEDDQAHWLISSWIDLLQPKMTGELTQQSLAATTRSEHYTEEGDRIPDLDELSS